MTKPTPKKTGKKHMTHFACKEVLERDGGKAIGCCCTGHKCQPQENQQGYRVMGDDGVLYDTTLSDTSENQQPTCEHGYCYPCETDPEHKKRHHEFIKPKCFCVCHNESMSERKIHGLLKCNCESPPSSSWADEFDKEFEDFYDLFDEREGSGKGSEAGHYDRLKDFISQTLAKEKAEAIEQTLSAVVKYYGLHEEDLQKLKKDLLSK